MSQRLTLVDPILGYTLNSGVWLPLGIVPIPCPGRYRLQGNHNYANPMAEVALATGPTLPKTLSEIPTITPSRSLLARMTCGSQAAGWNTMDLDITVPQVYIWLRGSSTLANWRFDLTLTFLGEIQ